MPIRTRRCTQCEQQKPLDDYRQAGTRNRSLRCIQCRKTYLAGLKKRMRCYRCRQRLPRESFECAPNGRRLVVNCKPCTEVIQAKLAERAQSDPLLSRRPCPNCQRYFRLSRKTSRIARVKYCSTECVLEMKAHKPKVCAACKQEKPLLAFGRHNTRLKRKGARRNRCIECYESAREQTILKWKLWAHPPSVRRAMQMHGKAYGKGDVSLNLAAWVLAQKCWLCGDGSRAARLIDTTSPWSKTNLHPLCSLCSRFIQVSGVYVLLVQANRIAAKRPLERPALPFGGGA